MSGGGRGVGHVCKEIQKYVWIRTVIENVLILSKDARFLLYLEEDKRPYEYSRNFTQINRYLIFAAIFASAPHWTTGIYTRLCRTVNEF